MDTRMKCQLPFRVLSALSLVTAIAGAGCGVEPVDAPIPDTSRLVVAPSTDVVGPPTGVVVPGVPLPKPGLPGMPGVSLPKPSLPGMPGVPLPLPGDLVTPNPGVPARLAAGPARTLMTFTGKALQIDSMGEGPGNANLFRGSDPTDDSPSRDFPECGAGSFVDWQDLAPERERYQVRDAQSAIEGDASVFVDGDCVDYGRLPREQDLLYAAAASNRHYLYLAVQRASDPIVPVQTIAQREPVAFSWLFTRQSPRFDEHETTCARGGRRLLYDLRAGDVLLTASFDRDATPLLRAFVATRDEDGVSATDAINAPRALWKERSDGLFAAINTDATAGGAFASAEAAPSSPVNPTAVDALPRPFAGDVIGAGAFIEAAVPLELIAGDEACGVRRFGSIVSHSPRSTASPLRAFDLIGPALFDLSTLRAKASLKPTCERGAAYDVSDVIGAEGMTLAAPDCSLAFDDGTSAADCHGMHELPLGSHGALATITDPNTGCELQMPLDAVDVYPALSVRTDVTGTCASVLGYDAVATGGRDPEHLAWSWFFGNAQGGSAASTQKSGQVVVSTNDLDWMAEVTVTEHRGALLCEASAVGHATPLAPFQVELMPTAAGGTACSVTTGAIQFEALISGGPAQRLYQWTGADCDGPTCMVSLPESEYCGSREVSVRVQDPSGRCPDAISPVARYQKVTEVRVTR